MLKILRKGEIFPAPCALLLGGFDGLHAGHLSLLEEAKRTGLPVGITSISCCKAGSDLFTFPEREYIFEKTGISFVIEEAFTEDFKNIPAGEYLRSLFSRVKPEAVFCGEDYRFGKDACGTPALLKRFAPCPVRVLPLASADGKKVSVSEIKIFLKERRIESANRLLAVPYFVQGEVEHGREEGRKIGFPTLNLSYPADKFTPSDGVYGGYAETPFGTFSAIVNFGSRPTFGVAEKKIEAHLKDFQGDLYGRTVRVFPQKYLREIKKFASEAELKKQLEKDKRTIW